MGAFSFVAVQFQTRAQTSVTEFLPEIDASIRLELECPPCFPGKGDERRRDRTRGETGPSIEFYLKLQIKLKEVTAFDLKDAKSRP